MSTCILKYTTPAKSPKKVFPENQIISYLPLKVFGSTVFVHVQNHLQSKFDPRAEKCIFLGHAYDRKRYKCLNPKTKSFH